MDKQRLARQMERGDLELAVCEDCGFVFNRRFDPSKLSYGECYDNSQTHSPYFEEYLSGLARCLVREKGVRNCRILEIGCGKGWFLRKLVESEDADNTGYGFDPSYVGPMLDLGGRLRFEKNYYGPEYEGIEADVVICRHVIEHLRDPLSLLRTIRKVMSTSPRARVFFETPCVERILRNLVIWDFFYEHCSYFTAQSLTTAFEAANFKVEGVGHFFGGQYLWLEAVPSDEMQPITKSAGFIPTLARHLAQSENALIESLRSKFRKLSTKGKVAIWGAGAKGVTIANLIDPECRCITCIVDLNPNKQSHYLPGTGHPIVSCEQLSQYGITHAILMNPNYRDENLALLRKLNFNIELIIPDLN